MDPVEETKQDLEEIRDDPTTPDDVVDEVKEMLEKYDTED